MLGFTAASFALAGLAAAAGPVIIHLLNRQRFRVVAWAAMDFLRDALVRKRRMLQVRDLILLVLRVLALVLFGLALARPFLMGGGWGAWTAALLLGLFVLTGLFAACWAVAQTRQGRLAFAALTGTSLVLLLLWGGWTWGGRAAADDGQAARHVPVHAVLIIDNSRSLGVETAQGTLLDQAKARALRFLDALPRDSRVTLIPLAGSVEPFPQDAFRSVEEARRALDRIFLVDVAGDVTAALEAAHEACRTTPELPTKRVAVLTDLQATAWSGVDWERWSKELPGLQIAPLSSGNDRNLWVADFALEDGIAGTEAPARFLARIRSTPESAAALSRGPQTTSSGDESWAVQVRLSVDGVEVGSRVVALSPGQTREVEFTHQFDIPGSPGRPHDSVAVLEIQPESLAADRLPSDNRVVRIVPVVSALPIVFVDQWGDQENVAQGRIGETYALRHLLAPRLTDDLSPRRLIQAVHVRPEEVTERLLETARLVIVAGVESPGTMTRVLREFVVQGGPLMVFAGGGFDPVAWQELAWQHGAGILAAPLLPRPMGATPQDVTELRPFFVDFDSLQHDDFLIAGEDPQALRALFQATPFFKAVQVDLTSETLETWRAAALARAEEELNFLRAWDQTRHRATALDSAERADEERWRRLEPNWWAWRSPLPLWKRDRTAEQWVEAEQPRVLATFQGGQTPWLVERSVGAGRIALWTSGVTSDWNLLRSSAVLYVFHRACHRLLESTLPRRNFQAGDRIVLPMSAVDDARFFVERPTGERERLVMEALGANVSGVIIRRPLLSGLYTVQSEAAEQGTTVGPTPPGGIEPNRAAAVDLKLAVQAPVSESELEVLPPWSLQHQLGPLGIRVLGVDEPLHLEGGLRRGQSLWKWCTGAMLAALLLEMVLLAGTKFTREAT
uniref:VWA domain-containing protein n=1 Tax=Schlesneria paludicola TaxID=360056 RepID=A0A7C4LKR8_9PLAN